MSATELVCAAPSQQRLRRSSVAAALRAASAPSQQHQLRRGRDAQNERDGAGLRSSVAAATPSQQRLRRSSVAAATPSQLRRSSDSVAAPSQQRCAHHERSTGQSKIIEQPVAVGKICQKQGDTTMTQPCDFNMILPKELRPLPCQGKNFFCVKKSCVWVVTHRIIDS